jgi:NitT/TauT family transport system ATP-binding protein
VFLSDRVVVLTRSPGRIKQVIDIALPRPRRRAELLVDRRYQEYVVAIEKLMDDPALLSSPPPLAGDVGERSSPGGG